MPEQEISQLSAKAQQEFAKLSEELGNIVLKQFNELLQKQGQGIEASLEKVVRRERNKILRQAERELEHMLKEQFSGDGVFGELLTTELLPNVFAKLNSGIGQARSAPSGFQASQGQQMLELGKAIQRVLGRFS